jgi:hypothetical protein
MAGLPQHPLYRSHLHQLACIEDGHPLCQAGDRGQVVGDDQQAHSPFPAQCVQQVQQSGPSEHILPTGRLVQHQHVRSTTEGHSQEGPLFLPAGELVGIGPQVTGLQPHPAGNFQCPAPCLPRGKPQVITHRLGNLVPDPVDRIQGRPHRLADLGDAAPSDGPPLLFGEPHQFPAVQADRALDALRRMKPQKRPGDSCFPRAGLPDDPQGRARRQFKGNTVHCPKAHPPVQRESHLQVLHCQ